MDDPHSTYDVVIAGAGPVGLFLACELRLRALSVLVLEQAEDPHTSLKQLPFGMRGLSYPTIEAFYRRGMLDEMSGPRLAELQSSNGGASSTAHWMHQPRRPGGHFAGIQFFHDKIDTKSWAYRLPSPVATNMVSTMEHVESVLTARAVATGVDIRRGMRIRDFEQSSEGVTVHGGDSMIRAHWLVGCDGGRSTVRKVGGFDFVGTDPEFTGYSVQIEMADPDQLPTGRHYTTTGMFTYQKPGIVAMVDFDGGAFHRTAPTLDHVQGVLRRISETDVKVTALHLATTWTDRAFQATTYRNGRVLLAGDAAHIHSPLGGQGLNLGLGDAMNLGWKLAATVRGEAPVGLLDTYTTERHPVGAQVLDWSRAQVAIMRPSRSSRALAGIIRDLIDTQDGATYFAERVWGVSWGYDLGGSHPLIGRSAPDFEFSDGSKLGDHLQSGKGLLLNFKTASPIRDLTQSFARKLISIESEVREPLGLEALLVRPDGVVAWVGNGRTDYQGFTEAAARWFGEG